jgi:hypothetical protein
MKDDIRYMSHEQRIAEGYMKAPPIPDPDKDRLVCCGCGKTVLKARGVSTGWQCPRVECTKRGPIY